MLHGQEVFRSIEVTDDVQTSQLSILDQLRLIFAKLSNDDAAELDTIEKVSADKLKKIASLSDFLDKAISRMQELGESSVTVKLSSIYLPYIDEVLDKKNGYGRYYDIEIYRKKLPITVHHYFIVRLKLRQTNIGGGT